MKKSFILLALTVISLSAVCQKKQKTAPAQTAPVETFQDSTGKAISDTDKVISLRDIRTFNVLLSKIPHDSYMTLSPNDAINEFYLWIMQRYNKPTQPKK